MLGTKLSVKHKCTTKHSQTTMDNSHIQPLHHCHALKLRATLNRTYSLFHFLALLAILYYRGTFFFNKKDPKFYMVPFIPWLVIFGGELFLTFMWVLRQPILWWPVIRTTFPERLPKDEELPGIDVFICTADPKREPTIDVMNTVISAMALDYPTQKLSVYLSDDGGASVTLNGLKEAWVFATWWLPFVKRYNVKTICPKAYFEELEESTQNEDLIEDRKIIKEKYEIFKNQVQQRIGRDEADNGISDAKINPRDYPPLVQVINGKTAENEDASAVNPEHTDHMPFLVYLAREKRPSHPHNFKAGALNVLLRVSSTMSNSPYILVLDCDMYCNGSSSARQAMCFHLDPKLSPSLGWVQYPHKFHNISEPDIYDSQMRSVWPALYPGMDGLQGPVLSGTNFYIKRQTLYGNDTKESKSSFGHSNVFIDSLSQIDKPHTIKSREISSASQQEAHFLASCTYEQGTKWGIKVGFRYKSLVEDVMTGLAAQNQGWRSVYLNPTRPEFLGSATTNLNDQLTQGSRWIAGLLQIGLSNCNPLFYRPSKMSFFQKLPSCWVSMYPLELIYVLCFAIVPPICFFYGIPLYPQVQDPFFIPFALAFISSQVKDLCQTLYICEGSVNSWLNEQRISMLKAVTCNVYGSLEFVMGKMGIREAIFTPTNKAGEDDSTKWYQIGKYDFRTSNMFLVPLVTLVTLNLLCFVGGVVRMIVARNFDNMFAQLLFSVYGLLMSFPVFEGALLRKDSGRVPLSTSLMSTLLAMASLSLGYIIVVL